MSSFIVNDIFNHTLERANTFIIIEITVNVSFLSLKVFLRHNTTKTNQSFIIIEFFPQLLTVKILKLLRLF